MHVRWRGLELPARVLVVLVRCAGADGPATAGFSATFGDGNAADRHQRTVEFAGFHLGVGDEPQQLGALDRVLRGAGGLKCRAELSSFQLSP